MSLAAQISIMCAVAAAVAGFALWRYLRQDSTPEKRERQRRFAVNAGGRLGDALITEVADEVLYYTYSVRGVQYAASQDVTSLRHLIPDDPQRLFGRTGMKYLSRNPANSILLCEEWSGLRSLAAAADLANRDRVGREAENPAMAEGIEG